MDITEKLFKFNPWREKEFSPSFINREKYLKILEKYLANPDIILITGLRRVGKTSLMKLLISRLLKTVESKFIYTFHWIPLLLNRLKSMKYYGLTAKFFGYLLTNEFICF